ncbi:class I SAM-dependent methyltransferase [Guptibacillus algicola]|uniref:class I SAM-dependent methyltransferase n=1 Tax=Guptibacillus algicola TaxID=225844 RepID=UPI001CD5C1F9|nr:class I SAM-dependent methyltransferase [Alkalihalobacillus algicola]MCA0987125.1 class I SAM-dependent methyltransferase [Alkalihalobacillus algicola]
MRVMKSLQAFIDKQYGEPTGITGMYLGEKMVKQHRIETMWTIDQLNLDRDETILELGCGAGYAIKMLCNEEAVSSIHALDLSFSVLKTAAIRNRKDVDDGKVTLVQGNVNYLPFKQDSFSKLFSIHSIYFWDDIPKTINEIHRVLQPKGTVILTLCNGINDSKKGGVTKMINEEVIPSMKLCGFKQIDLLSGPESRGYHMIAVKGVK